MDFSPVYGKLSRKEERFVISCSNERPGSSIALGSLRCVLKIYVCHELLSCIVKIGCCVLKIGSFVVSFLCIAVRVVGHRENWLLHCEFLCYTV